MKTELIPITTEMIPAAGKLLAERHARNRKTVPGLPDRFEDAETAAKAIEALLTKKENHGYAAMRGGKMIAYLIGMITVEPWGRCGWVTLPGSALAANESPATLQDLYTLLGDDWVNQGVFIHHTYLSKGDEELIKAWFDLDFGKERIDALLDLEQVRIPEIRVPEGIQIRRAVPGDNDSLAGLSHLIYRELEKAPYWHPTPPEVWDEMRKGWGRLADEQDVNVWLAFDGDHALGMIGTWKEEPGPTEMLVGPSTFTLSVAATRPESRGLGIATALTWTCLAHNCEAGFAQCHADWISPNLSASRFWPRFGFREVAYRLTKQLNPMIAWTRNI